MPRPWRNPLHPGPFGRGPQRSLIKHKKVLRLAKHFGGRHRTSYKLALRKLHKSWLHAFKGRKERGREMRKHWIVRINAATREHDMAYSRYIAGLQGDSIWLNRKMMADLAVNEPYSFKATVEAATSSLERRHPVMERWRWRNPQLEL